jgi:hypothetical protein
LRAGWSFHVAWLRDCRAVEPVLDKPSTQERAAMGAQGHGLVCSGRPHLEIDKQRLFELIDGKWLR